MGCYCGNEEDYATCCEKIHTNTRKADTAEELMRSRYSAFVVHNIDYLYNSVHPKIRKLQNKSEIELWAVSNKWMKLEIIKSSKSTVEFKAYYLDRNHQTHIHHEKSNFSLVDGVWYYVDGTYG